MENCEKILDLLNQYADGELGESDAQLVSAHLEVCPSCKKAYEELLEMIRPGYSVITDSKKNPTDERTLLILKKYNVKNYETRNGTVSAKTDGSEISINQ